MRGRLLDDSQWESPSADDRTVRDIEPPVQASSVISSNWSVINRKRFDVSHLDIPAA